MKNCLNCEEIAEKNEDYCEDCAFERLRDYIEELHQKQIEEEKD